MNPEKRPLNSLQNLTEGWRNLPLGRKLQVGGAVLLVALSSADVATTYLGLQLGLNESYPLTRHLMDKLGVLGGIAGLNGTLGTLILGCSEATRYIEQRYASKRVGGFVTSNLILGTANLIAADNVINNIHLLKIT